MSCRKVLGQKEEEVIEQFRILWRVYLFLGSDSVNTFPSNQTLSTIDRLFFVRSVQSVRQNGVSSREVKSLVSGLQSAGIWTWNWIESSLRNWQMQNNDKKGIRLRKEGFMCDVKLQWNCYKSVVRIRLVKSEALLRVQRSTVNCVE
jgi:hypothetical protein